MTVLKEHTVHNKEGCRQTFASKKGECTKARTYYILKHAMYSIFSGCQINARPFSSH